MSDCSGSQLSGARAAGTDGIAESLRLGSHGVVVLAVYGLDPRFQCKRPIALHAYTPIGQPVKSSQSQ